MTPYPPSPPSRPIRTHLIRLVAASVAVTLVAAVAWVATAQAAGGPNLSLGKTATASSANGAYVAGNLNDGNQATYWESANNSFPQWAQIDLATSVSIDQVVLKLPTGWGSRTQTLSLQGSTNGSGFATIVSSAPYTFNPASGNTVTINFTAFTTRYVRVNITANSGWPAAQLSELEIYGAEQTGGGNLAAGRPTAESGHADVYPSGNIVDGNQATYWESVNNAFPQWAQVDLGLTVSVNRVVLKLPVGWGTRNQTLAVQGSTNGSTFTDITGPATYTFNPGTGNSVTINVTATDTRYIRIRITANTAWPAGQLSELEVYGPGGGGGDTTPPTVPGPLSYAQSGTTITLNWGASTDTGGSGLAAYDIYRDGSLATSVGAGVTTFAETQPTNVTVSYFVRARDGAGNESGASNTVTRVGSGGPGTNVAVSKPVTATGSTFTFIPANATDGNVTTYWEGSPTYPQDLTVGAGRQPHHHLGGGEAQPRPRLGHPYPDLPGSQPGAVVQHVHQPGLGGDLYLHAGHERGDDSGQCDGCRCPTAVHREQRCTLRSGGRARGLRHPVTEPGSGRQQRDLVAGEPGREPDGDTERDRRERR